MNLSRGAERQVSYVLPDKIMGGQIFNTSLAHPECSQDIKVPVQL